MKRYHLGLLDHDLGRSFPGFTLIAPMAHSEVTLISNACEIVWDYVCPWRHPVPVLQAPGNALFRAYRYAPEAPEIGGRL